MSKISSEELQQLNEQSYESLLALWADLESALHMVLLYPEKVQGFQKKLHELYQWQTDLISQDSDAALYLMFQIASVSTVGYSASHSLVCSTLGQILAPYLNLSEQEMKLLSLTAMTMNIGMTRLQDTLALQMERPSAEQEELIRTHPMVGRDMLKDLGIDDPLWLDIVLNQHNPPTEKTPLHSLSASQRLTRILSSIDRYAAMISPRKSRPGKSVADSLKAIIGQRFDPKDEVAKALSRAVGQNPPGTLVKLENQDIAIVLRRSQQVNQPLIASLINSKNQQYDPPPLYFTGAGGPRIVSSLPRSAITFHLSHKTMISLGIFAARQNSA